MILSTVQQRTVKMETVALVPKARRKPVGPPPAFDRPGADLPDRWVRSPEPFTSPRPNKSAIETDQVSNTAHTSSHVDNEELVQAPEAEEYTSR